MQFYILQIILIYCTYGCFRKSWYPQISHFNRVFHYKPSMLGYPYFWKYPYIDVFHRFFSVCLGAVAIDFGSPALWEQFQSNYGPSASSLGMCRGGPEFSTV